jgi:Leucine-rich repeat (LRR) protein
MKKKLRHLNLANNSLTEIDIEILQQLDELETLDLSHNDFNKISVEVRIFFFNK